MTTTPRQVGLPNISRDLEACIEQACQIIQTATEVYRPSTRYALFSGGRDSLVTTHLCMEQFGFDGAVFIDTGIGAAETKEYVRRICDRNGWPLQIYAADEYVRGNGTPDPQIYEELVVPPAVRRGELTWLERGGFPGPTERSHGKMFDRLKGRPISQLVRESKQATRHTPSRPPDEWQWKGWLPTTGKTTANEIFDTEASRVTGGGRSKTYDRIMLVTGVYADESGRRFQLKGKSTPINRDGAQLWVNPCFHWQSRHMEGYRAQADVNVNPIYRYGLGSMECNCGAFAKDGELAEVGRACPAIARRLKNLDELSDEYGYFWGWEEGPPESVVEAKKEVRGEGDDQLDLELARGNVCNDCGFFGDEDGQKRAEQFQKAWELTANVDIADRINAAMREIRERENA